MVIYLGEKPLYDQTATTQAPRVVNGFVCVVEFSSGSAVITCNIIVKILEDRKQLAHWQTQIRENSLS